LNVAVDKVDNNI